MLSKVLLPEPEGSTIAQLSPRLSVRLIFVEHRQGLPGHGVGLANVFQADQFLFRVWLYICHCFFFAALCL
jgi:hypothetical protein